MSNGSYHASYMQGHALYSNYGNKSNEELILGYGFALPNNPADFFHVMIGLGRQPGGEAGMGGQLHDICIKLTCTTDSVTLHDCLQ